MCAVPVQFRRANLAVSPPQPGQPGGTDQHAGHQAPGSGQHAAIGQCRQPDDHDGYSDCDRDNARRIRAVLHRFAGVLPGGPMVVNWVDLGIGHFYSLREQQFYPAGRGAKT